MTTHYYKALKDLTADEVWEDAQRHLIWSDGTSYRPGAYGMFSEADAYAYDAWGYLDYLKKGTKPPEEWCSNIDDIEKRDSYINLLKGVLECQAKK